MTPLFLLRSKFFQQGAGLKTITVPYHLLKQASQVNRQGDFLRYIFKAKGLLSK